jgi:hypothetical protein
MAGKSFSLPQIALIVAIALIGAGVGIAANPDAKNEYGWALLIVGCVFTVIAIVGYVRKTRIERGLSRVLSRLTELREQGVNIRNDGMSLKGEDELASWIMRVDDWNKAVMGEIGKISKNDALYFKTLNLVPQLGFNCQILNHQHLKYLNEHNERVRRLEELINKYDLQ